MHQPHFSFLNQLSSHRPYWSLKFSIFAVPFSNSESHCSFHKKILIPVNIDKDLHCFWCATVVSAVTRYEPLVHWHLNTARLLAALTLKQLLPQLHYFPLPIHYPHLRNHWHTCITNFNGTATAFTFYPHRTLFHDTYSESSLETPNSWNLNLKIAKMLTLGILKYWSQTKCGKELHIDP